jgi:hypothetical protein
MDLLLYLLVCFSLSTALVSLSYVGGWALMNLLRRRGIERKRPHAGT